MSETSLWKDYCKGRDWQRAMGFTDSFPLFVRFKEGDQWPPATRRTKNLPRPVFNMVEMFIRTKRAAVLDQTVSMHCRPLLESSSTLTQPQAAALAAQGARDFGDYARQLWKRLGQDDLNSVMVDDAATQGTGILHYYWDTTVRGGGSSEPYVGEVRGEVIDPLAVIFADPHCKSVQRQPWIMLVQQLPAQTVRAMASAAGLPEDQVRDISADDQRPPYPADLAGAADGRQRITLLTRYFRHEGEIWYQQATRTHELTGPRPLTPQGSAGRMTHYPLALLPWRSRKNCIFGIGEAEDLIPSQKALNYNMAMMLLSVQATGWPKLLTKPGALQQPVTNEPGEVLVDNWQGGGDGIRYLQAPTFSSLAVGLSEKVLALSRDVSGVGEVTTGESQRPDMAAAAIIALQNQARTPIREIQRRFWRMLEQVGDIWLDFFRCYHSTPRLVAGDAPNALARSFTGTDYAAVEYEMTVDVGPSGEYSEVLSQATLDKLLDKGLLTVDQYIDLSGPNVVPFREKYREMVGTN